MKRLAEYIWIDGTKPTSLLRSKTRVIEIESDNSMGIEIIPINKIRIGRFHNIMS